MSEPIIGKQEFTDPSTGQVRVVVDGGSGDVTVGGQGINGTLVIKNEKNETIASLGGTQDFGGEGFPIWGELKINDESGKTGFWYSAQDGRLTLSSDTGAEIFRVDSSKQEFTLKNGDGEGVSIGANGEVRIQDFFHISKDGGMRIGGKKGGVFTVKDKNGDEIFRADSSKREFTIKGSKGRDRINLIADRGKIVLGGNGEHGDLLVFAEDKEDGLTGDADRSDPHNAAIWIRGGRGDILLANGDCAEDFDVSGTDEVEPGTVMVLDQDGKLVQSTKAYDKKVAGVISGAGDHRPGIVLDRKPSQSGRHPVALLGKSYCKVDAQYAPIEVGDLLTTSPTPGHAMKANDPLTAFGAVIGKALRPLDAGAGLIPVLIALQ